MSSRISAYDPKNWYERWVSVEVKEDGACVSHEPDMYEIRNHAGEIVYAYPRKNRTYPEFVAWAASMGVLINVDADLRGIDFGGLDLRRANFTGCDLRGANFQYCHMSGAFLVGADLRGANLQGSDIENAYTTNAIL